MSDEIEKPVKKARVKKPPKPTYAQLLEQTCTACPFKEFKCEDGPIDESSLDVLIISEQRMYSLAHSFDNLQAKHVYLTECNPETATKVDIKNAKIACTGRKLGLIVTRKPKVVVTIGYGAFKELETALGFKPKGVCDATFLPSEFNGQKFWHISLPDFDTRRRLDALIPEIEEKAKELPVILQGNFNGLEFITDTEEIDPAFDWLESQEFVGFDIETNGLKPYKPGSKLLSIAIGTEEKTYAFPLYHPQTPGNFDPELVLARLKKLAGKTKLIAHNLIFELEWLNYFVKNFAFSSEFFQDTMAQAYLLSNHPKSLDFCIRKYFGFSLKKISDIDVTKLEETNLDVVLSYNALDTKYTHSLFMKQKELITAENLDNIYRFQVDRLPMLALAQNKGIKVNDEFVQIESEKMSRESAKALEEFNNIPEVKQMVADGFVCNPFSKPNREMLMWDYCGVDRKQKSFDEEFLSNFKHPVAKAILDLRKINKAYGTYLKPFNVLDENEDLEEGEEEKEVKELKDNKIVVWADGRVHTSFNAMKTLTGRLSSSSCNLQNLPGTRSGKKYLRSVLHAPEGYSLISGDFSAAEYRTIASLANDPKMIDAIWNGLDIHKEWALKILDYFPNKVKDRNDPEQISNFRSLIKNQFIFPACYGSSMHSICESLGVRNKSKFLPIWQEFWKEHIGIKNWHDQLKRDIETKKFITTPFGRKFRAPLSFNALTNYGPQSTASDMLLKSAMKLAKYSIDYDEPDLAPVLLVHDDAIFVVRDDKIEDLLPIIIECLIDDSEYKEWFKVPIETEIQIGKAWGDIKKIGKFSSATWEFS